MKEHFKTLFLKSLNDLEVSVQVLNENMTTFTRLYYPNEPFVTCKKLERMTDGILQSLAQHERNIKHYDFDASVVSNAAKYIKIMIDTDMQIFLAEMENLVAHLKKEEFLILMGKRKDIIRKLESFMYEKDNVVMIPHMDQRAANVVPLKPKTIKKGHLTLVKS